MTMGMTRIAYKIKRAAGAYYGLYIKKALPVIIYTSGRVGSMALFRSLDARGVLVFHVHCLNPVKLKTKNYPGSWSWAYRHIVAGGKPARIISVVRDPVDLMISDFFPKLKRMVQRQRAYETCSVEELCTLFTTQYFEEKRHNRILGWFETEMRTALGLDVYAHDFSAQDGYGTFRQEPWNVLIIKTELDDKRKAALVGDFLGLKDFILFRSNTSATKEYAQAYAQFRHELVIPPALLDIIYSSPYARHFYTPREIETKYRYWETSRKQHALVP